LFHARQECARATQRQRNRQGANQEAATQAIHSVAKHQRQAHAHGSLSLFKCSGSDPRVQRKKTAMSRLSWASVCHHAIGPGWSATRKLTPNVGWRQAFSLFAKGCAPPATLWVFGWEVL